MTCTNCNNCMFDGKTLSADMHEIHITVDAKHTEQFISVCKQHAIKPIVISYGDSYLDPMTSHKFRGTIDAAHDEITRVVNILLNATPTIPTIRIKAETTTNNPVVMLNTGYYESHLGITVPSSDEHRLRAFVGNISQLHLSSNAMKSTGDINTIMATYRARNITSVKFTADVEEYRSLLEAANFTVDKQIVEYCWVDTNENHDNAWFSNK